ncbi:MAG TPA: ATP-binding cassette domain-containing protein [Candidatus Tetragenococcus pullicola]|nr:ATP-binding cassette domain-containing protein [Candidatus Tetragenococcus pullicola]
MPLLEIKNGTKVISNGAHETKRLLNNINLKIEKGQFVTVLGGNGAGKSTLFNTISGTTRLTKGQVFISGKEITHLSEEDRASVISRVFQDPKMGTAPRMTVAENLLLALGRGQKRKLKLRNLADRTEEFKALCRQTENGLEDKLNTPTGDLSGGQRQALSLLMATITSPDVLLLDEHTAALDPKTAKKLMEMTAEKIAEQQLTCLMITHRMEDALKYGNRLIVMQKAEVIQDLNEEEKSHLTMNDLLHFFEEIL